MTRGCFALAAKAARCLPIKPACCCGRRTRACLRGGQTTCLTPALAPPAPSYRLYHLLRAKNAPEVGTQTRRAPSIARDTARHRGRNGCRRRPPKAPEQWRVGLRVTRHERLLRVGDTPGHPPLARRWLRTRDDSSLQRSYCHWSGVCGRLSRRIDRGSSALSEGHALALCVCAETYN